MDMAKSEIVVGGAKLYKAEYPLRYGASFNTAKKPPADPTGGTVVFGAGNTGVAGKVSPKSAGD